MRGHVISTPYRGDVFAKRVLHEMRRIVNRAIRDPYVVESAVQIVQCVDGRDQTDLALHIERWLRVCISFMADPLVNGDVLRTPGYVLNQIAVHGVARIDCDDAAMLSAALGKSVGLMARFHAMGFYGESLSHVYTELEGNDGWVVLDVTEPPERRVPPTSEAVLNV